MVWGFLVIAGSYGLAVMLIHALFRRQQAKAKNRLMRCVLITKNNEGQIEWYLRSFLFFSRMGGRQMVIYVFDNESTDETRGILEAFARSRENILIKRSLGELDAFLEEYENEALFLLQLNRSGLSPQQAMQYW
jgi:predicted ATPase